MIETLRGFAVMLVFCAAAGLVYYFLLPSGRLSQTAKGVLSAVFLLCVLTPLVTLVRGRLPEISPTPENASVYDYGYVEQAARETLTRTVEAAVRNVTNAPYELQADMYIAEDGGIHIERVSIVFGAYEPGAEALRDALTAALGFTPEMRFGEEP